MKLDSRKLNAYKKKLANYPKVVETTLSTGAEYHADAFLKILWDGLKNNNLVKPPLKPMTVEIKRRNGKPYTYQPLVGMGETDKRSMINGLKKIKKGKGWMIRPSGKHYSGADMKMIWNVHENGATITNGFGKGIIIKIPKREPVRKAFIRYMQSRQKKETNKNIKKLITDFLRNMK